MMSNPKSNEPSSLFILVEDGLECHLKVTPRAAKNKLGDIVPGAYHRQVLKVSITTAAEQGKANEAVIKLLAKTWHLSKTQITIKQGETSRNKWVHIKGSASLLLLHLKKYFSHPLPKTND